MKKACSQIVNGKQTEYKATAKMKCGRRTVSESFTDEFTVSNAGGR